MKDSYLCDKWSPAFIVKLPAILLWQNNKMWLYFKIVSLSQMMSAKVLRNPYHLNVETI